ncbi:MAG: hypothetical protein QOH48_345 [Actinomycetota bacterium]|nr:hypothetical protein [Actinomycetota bacterium]
MEAQINGLQRKIISSSVRPLTIGHGDSGIPLRNGRTLPFVVARSWSAPAGHYDEAWYLVEPTTREVLFEGSNREVRVWGLQSWTEFSDTVTEAIPLKAGAYLIIFALGGSQGGQMTVAAADVKQSAA